MLYLFYSKKLIMKNSEHLFYLIKSLSKSEKKSFKLIVNQYSKGDDNNYTLLFDTIGQMEVYNHELLIKKLKNKVKAVNISPLKVQLTKIILKSLRNKYSTSNVSFRITMYIDYIAILFEKGLYAQAKKILSKAKEVAIENELYLQLDNLAIWEYKIADKESNKEDIKSYLEKTYVTIKKARELNDILAEFEFLQAKIRLIALEGKTISSKSTVLQLEEIIQNPVMKLEIENYSSSCQADYHSIWGHYHFIKGNKHESYDHRKKAFELIPFKPFIIREWLTYARQLLNGLSKFKMYEEYTIELAYMLDKIKQVPKEVRTNSFEDELNTTLFNLNLNNDLTEGNFSEIQEYIEEIEVLLTTTTYQIDCNLRMVFQYNLCYAYIGSGNYKRALLWSNSLINNTSGLREDLQCNVRIMNICIHYKLGNFGLIENLIQSTSRFLNKKNRLNEIELAFLDFSKTNLIAPNVNKLVIQKDLNNLELLRNSEEAKSTLDYFDFISCLKSIIENKTMENIIKEATTVNSDSVS